jgi:hypothetical protein
MTWPDVGTKKRGSLSNLSMVRGEHFTAIKSNKSLGVGPSWMQENFEQGPANSHEMNRTRMYETTVCFTKKETCNLVRELALARVLGGAIEVNDLNTQPSRNLLVPVGSRENRREPCQVPSVPSSLLTLSH